MNTLEEREPYVDVDVLARARPPGAGTPRTNEELLALLNAAVQQGVFYTDRRLRLDRATGSLFAASVYRVNHQHPLVAETLQS